MSELFGEEKRKELLKSLIKRLHDGVNPEEIKKNFREILKESSPEEIAKIEEELIKEGMPKEEIQRLCDVHISIFEESLKKDESTDKGHPINILMAEHDFLLKLAEELKKIAFSISRNKDLDQKERKYLFQIVQHFKDSESHYLREENVLFPYLERHGITQPPMIMWSEHQEIRKKKNALYQLFEKLDSKGIEKFAEELKEISTQIEYLLQNHFFKENKILFPTALKVINENYWREIKREFDEIGYCCFTSTSKGEIERKEVEKLTKEGSIDLPTGNLKVEELETVLNTLPVDITFVDKEDTVKYFSESKDRIFIRTKAVIGRKVQNCHPLESLNKVEQILDDFKRGRRDVAEFWINYRGRLIHIRYFALRDREGEYLGCLEVTQDITEIKKIEGEKRLLD